MGKQATGDLVTEPAPKCCDTQMRGQAPSAYTIASTAKGHLRAAEPQAANEASRWRPGAAMRAGARM